jgi:hypothetical protein
MSDDVHADSKDILNFCLLFNVCGVKDVMQSEIHADPLTSEYNPFEVEITVENLMRYQSQVVVRFPL